MLVKLDVYMQRIKMDLYLIPYINISSKGFKDFKIIPETVKLQEENTEGSLLDFNLGNDFLDMTQKAQATKTHIDKWDHIKLKSFCRVKETTNKMTRQTTEWEKILANSVFEELLQLNSKIIIIIITFENGQINRHFWFVNFYLYYSLISKYHLFFYYFDFIFFFEVQLLQIYLTN